MTPATDIRRRAIELIEQLPIDRLNAVVQLLEFLSEPIQQDVASPGEVALIDVIQRCLPMDEHQRLNELRVSEAFHRKHWEYGELADSEHEELG